MGTFDKKNAEYMPKKISQTAVDFGYHVNGI